MQKNQTKNESSHYEDDSYLDVSMSIQETIGEILNSEEVRKEILDDLRKKGLDVILPSSDVDFSESFGDDMSTIIDRYLECGAVIDGVEQKPLDEETIKSIKELV